MAMAYSRVLHNLQLLSHPLAASRCSIASFRLPSALAGRTYVTVHTCLRRHSISIHPTVAMASTAAAGVAPPADVGSQVKKVLVPIGNGTEEMEAVIIIDILRRAGADVAAASVEDELQILASRNVKLEADTSISNCEGQTYDLVVLPGGMPGSERLRDNEVLRKITETQAQQNRLYGAICAAPAVALESWGLLKGVLATCHPAFADKLSKSSESRVLKDGLVTTSKGPGTAIEFALSLVEQLYGKHKAEEVAEGLVLRPENSSESSVKEYNAHSWSAGNSGKPPRALVPIAHGSEEMEVVIVVDVLRRAGVNVIVASIEPELKVVASRKVKIVADNLVGDLVESNFDLVIIPGGMSGATRIADSVPLVKILKKQAAESRPYGAICAAPAVVLKAKQLLEGKKATAYPSFASQLSDQSSIDSRVVIDGLVITSRGPGTAMEFALAIVEKLFGREKALAIAAPMVFPYA